MSANAAAARVRSAVTIRPLTVADAAALKACRVAGLQETPEAFLSTAAEIETTPVAQFEAELADADIRYAGAFDGEGLVGFMRTVRFSRRARRHVAEVRSVVVRASHRRQGIAGRLLSQLIAQARDSGIEALLLTVVAGNLPARRLYEQAGFAVYGIEPCAVRRDGVDEDQLLMRLALQAPGP
ncbi:GNAT family N-acetyltransferase [Pseudoxanthomonas winnipegensis]|jgi:ribosomal protein S18 acetylase RimI-like enzyme|uniref:GNAT family N-acetyltransferase n=1 Tax=Pseudoxanthomonas winnipegensis TaxID=2480810 RepID=A0ABY1WBR3_9GAMM|nr:GNAT family N-acetyltransferase [Pseudoxanthomonas winnipegensis]TAA18454.1 GNAT family N-acetyltransferase [Pseudoxanthomonas winnipegensis]TAH74170.1 GNAT family N-acetyltransferase [Pseudoxanthomonas winnipegensis]